MDDVLSLPPYTPKVTPPTPVAEEGPSASTGRERERVPPLTPPTAPTRTHEPARREPMQLPSGLAPSLPRSHSARTHRSSDAAPSSAAPSTADPRGAKEARLMRQAEYTAQQDDPKRQNVVNIFCCCSSPGTCPGHFSIILLPTHFCNPNNGLPVERTKELSCPDLPLQLTRLHTIKQGQNRRACYVTMRADLYDVVES